MGHAESMIEVKSLTRRYGDLIAVDRISFSVARGEIFGLLGPNGAGKSTSIRMLTGYLPPDGGQALIAGFDAHREPTLARAHLGVVPEWRVFIITGFCGGLTTFSTFSAEVVTLLQEDRLTWAMGAIAAHVTGSLVMTVAGLATWQLLKHC
jgi:ABC-type branched-subunit amino acid transport system ATPase component